MNYIISIVIGYFFGCIQSSYLIGKFFLKEDVRKKGNGNAGASNMTVAFGKRFGVAVAVIDILKSVIAIFMVRFFFKELDFVNIYIYLTGFFVIIGHNYPFYMNFKGGKGTASLVGMIFGLNYIMGIISIIVFILSTLISDYIAIGTFSLLIVFMIITYTFSYGIIPFIISILISLLSIYKHRQNIINILNEDERSVRKTLFKQEKGND